LTTNETVRMENSQVNRGKGHGTSPSCEDKLSKTASPFKPAPDGTAETMFVKTLKATKPNGVT